MYAEVVGGHRGVEKTGSCLKEKVFWPGMNVWCAVCEKCQRRKPPPRKKRSAMQIMVPDIPWARVAVDMIEPLPRTARRSRYVLVVADYFTKWTEAFLMENGDCLFVCWISLTPGQLISELFPDCTRSCFTQVVLRRRGGDRIYEMRCLFVAVGPNARFRVLPHWDNMS